MKPGMTLRQAAEVGDEPVLQGPALAAPWSRGPLCGSRSDSMASRSHGLMVSHGISWSHGLVASWSHGVMVSPVPKRVILCVAVLRSRDPPDWVVAFDWGTVFLVSLPSILSCYGYGLRALAGRHQRRRCGCDRGPLAKPLPKIPSSGVRVLAQQASKAMATMQPGV